MVSPVSRIDNRKRIANRKKQKKQFADCIYKILIFNYLNLIWCFQKTCGESGCNPYATQQNKTTKNGNM
ncbi:MAG: hypothetical protein EAZ95_00630 [Bacteroidetes bacterium]|nr:MAG: hypothetical protein EAZ95_00630 [Bacteroidota bacterium]